MNPGTKIQSLNDNLQPGSMPPLLPAPDPSVIGPPPPLLAASPPPLPPEVTGKSRPVRKLIATLLSLCLGLFLVDAVVSLVDDSLILFFGIHFFTAIRGIVFFFAILLALLIYGLMGLTPMIPKRFFLPITLFNPVVGLLVIPSLIYFYDRIEQVAWGTSL